MVHKILEQTKMHWQPIVAICALTLALILAIQKPVTVIADDKQISNRYILPATVEDVLADNNIVLGERDSVEPALDTRIQKNTRVVVNRAFKVSVIGDGIKKDIYTSPVAVEEAIKLAGFTLGENDIVKTQAVEKTFPNQEIEIIRVTEEEICEEKVIPYGTETTVDQSLERGLSRTIKAGKNGLALDTIKITYYNGKEEKRQLVKSEIKQKPENKIIAMGTITSVSRGSQRLNFREALYMEASAYTYTGNRTATGKQPAVGIVAVDPRVIPLGTRLYIEGYGYAQAEDVGGAVKGNKIDLFMEEYQQCINWGRRTVKVYILQ